MVRWAQPRPWSCQALCGGRSDCASGLGLSPHTPANLECWNFLSDFHFPPLFSPLSETKTLFNCMLWSASQDIIILIKCFLWGSAGHGEWLWKQPVPRLLLGVTVLFA